MRLKVKFSINRPQSDIILAHRFHLMEKSWRKISKEKWNQEFFSSREQQMKMMAIVIFSHLLDSMKIQYKKNFQGFFFHSGDTWRKCFSSSSMSLTEQLFFESFFDTFESTVLDNDAALTVIDI